HDTYKQLDVVLPSSNAVEASVIALGSSFSKATRTLLSVYEDATRVNTSSGFTALSSYSSGIDDTWCIDHRRLLTICASKTTYERLGLVGTKIPSEKYVIRIPLQEATTSVTNRARVRTALEAWDKWRHEEGLGPWKILYHCNEHSADTAVLDGQSLHRVQPEVRRYSSMRIPLPSFSPRPPPQNADALEDWHDTIHGLFEWAGMAALGSQRLETTDHVDPYIGVYEHPEPSTAGSVTHVRWRGFLAPAFVQSVLDALRYPIPSSAQISSASLTPSFISVTAHTFPHTPVSYISPATANKVDSPVRVPRDNAEHTWSVILLRDSSGQPAFVKAESVGQLDTRWG
ncbi:hypothetical protein PLICRDRAFT_115378, partial [Plicaturopsis crispa FD-325 SS-3]